MVLFGDGLGSANDDRYMMDETNFGLGCSGFEADNLVGI